MTAALEMELSRFVAELDFDDLPVPVRDRVVDLWADTVANGLVGRRASNTAVVERLATRLTGPGDSPVLGGATASLTGAALINGYQITAYTMCDVYRPALCHITPEVVPAVLGVITAAQADGRALLTGLAVGLEVTARLGLGVDYPRFRARGWHAPGIIGTIGAAAGAARGIGLDDRGVRSAMGLGGSQAAGTFAALGTPAVKFHQARGAVSGLWAALFAADGLGGTERVLTHDDGGLLATYADGGRPELVTAGLGQRWELENISLRRWPAASSLQSLVAELLDIQISDPELRPDDIDRVEISLPPTSYALCGSMGWQDELTAMQSAHYVAAVVLADRQCWIEQFGADRRGDSSVDEFARSRVTIERQDDLGAAGVEIRLHRRDGAAIVVRRDVAPGEPGEPLTRAQIRAKLAAAVVDTPVAGAARIDEAVFQTGGLSAAEVSASLRAAPSPQAERSGDDHAHHR